MLRKRLKRLVRRRVLRTRRRRTWTAAEKQHYQEYKEAARTLVHQRLEHFNQHYQLSYNRISIKNTRSRWGSCSSKQNLNFSYKLLFLPTHLRDYIIVHELCHLKEMNHRPQFWTLVAEQIPEYRNCVTELRAIDRLGGSIQTLETVKKKYFTESPQTVAEV